MDEEAVDPNADTDAGEEPVAQVAVVGHTIEVYGASDDLVEVDGKAEGCDEYPAVNESRAFVVTDTAGSRVLIAVNYTNGVWSVGVRPVEEDVPAPPVHINARGYTAVATIHNVVSVEQLA